MTGPIFIVPCGDKKLPHAAPARDLYTGQQFRYVFDLADKAAKASGGAVLILSALHGLVEPERVLEPYNKKMGDPGSITVEQLRKQVRRMNLADYRPIYAFLARPYYERLEAALAAEGGHAEDVYDVPTKTARGGRIQLGEQKTRARSFLGAFVEGAADVGEIPEDVHRMARGLAEYQSEGTQVRIRDFPEGTRKDRAGSFPQVPFDASRVTFFASGSNLAPELRALSLIPGGNAGVVAKLVDPQKYPQTKIEIQNLLWKGHKLFIDSGAFGEVEFPEDGPPQIVDPITDADWEKVFSIYDQYADDNVYVVAPDCVGHEKESLERLRRYAHRMTHPYELGATILVPLQQGPRGLVDYYRRAEKCMEVPFTPSLPMKKNATTFEEALAFVEEVRPSGIHLLGMGVDTRGAQELIAAIQAVVPDCAISCDACLITRWTGKKGETRRLTQADEVIAKKLALSPDEVGEHKVFVRKQLTLFLAAYNFWVDLGLAKRPRYRGIDAPAGALEELEPAFVNLAYALWGIEEDSPETPRVSPVLEQAVAQEVDTVLAKAEKAPPTARSAPLDFDVKAYCRRYYDERGLNDRTLNPDDCTDAALQEAERQGTPLVRKDVLKAATKAFHKALAAY